MALTVYGADGRPKGKGLSSAPQGVVCKMRWPNDTAVSAGGPSKIQSGMSEKVFDPYNFYDAVTNYRFQPKIPGYYKVTFQCTTLNTGAGTELRISKNGISAPYEGSNVNAMSGAWTWGHATALVYLNGSTDYVETYVYCPSAGTIKGYSGGSTVQPTQIEYELMATSVGVAPEPWHIVGGTGEPGFSAGWSTIGDGAETLRFMKDPHGFVHIEGFANTNGTGIEVFVLPVGYRPVGQYTQGPAVMWLSPSYQSAQWQARNQLAPGGSFRLYNNAGGTPPNLAQYAVSVVFRAEG